MPYAAVAALQNGRDFSCTATATWSSSDPDVVFVEQNGWATGLRPGPVTLTAVCWGISGSLQETVREGAVLFGTVRDAERRPIAGAGVSVVGRWKGGWFSETDSGGAYRIGGMPRGDSYTVTAHKAGFERSSAAMTLEAAEARYDFALRVGVRVSGEVLEAGVGPLVGATVEVVSGPNAGRKAVTSQNGYFELPHLLPGLLTLRAGKAGYVPDEDLVEALDDVSHRFELRPSLGTCLSPIAPPVVDRFPSAGGDWTLMVPAAPGRSWSAASEQAWVEFPAGQAGSGPGELLLHVLPAAPGATDVRTAVIRVGCSATEGDHFRIVQLPAWGESVTWAVGSPSSFPASGGAGSVQVRTRVPRCRWESVSEAAWLRTVGVNSWAGDFDVSFTVDRNAGAARVGTLVFGEARWEVRQAGR